MREEKKTLNQEECKQLLDKRFDEYLKILLNIGALVCDYINKYILFDNIQTKFENILFQSIFRSSKQYSGKVVSMENPNKIKDKYSGTILKKRSYSYIHKHIIDEINKNIEMHLKYRMKIKASNLEQILNTVIQSYYDLFESDDIDINDFIITRKYNSNYINPDNHNFEIVKLYNSQVGKLEEISVGSRYSYIYITDNVIERYTKIPAGKSKHEFIVTDHKIVNGYIINNKIKRLDESKKYRIFYEIYFERIFGDIVRLYYNTSMFNYAMDTYKTLFGKKFDVKNLKI